MGGLGCDNMTVVLVCFLQDEPWEELIRKCSRMRPLTPSGEEDSEGSQSGFETPPVTPVHRTFSGKKQSGNCAVYSNLINSTTPLTVPELSQLAASEMVSGNSVEENSACLMYDVVNLSQVAVADQTVPDIEDTEANNSSGSTAKILSDTIACQQSSNPFVVETCLEKRQISSNVDIHNNETTSIVETAAIVCSTNQEEDDEKPPHQFEVEIKHCDQYQCGEEAIVTSSDNVTAVGNDKSIIKPLKTDDKL